MGPIIPPESRAVLFDAADQVESAVGTQQPWSVQITSRRPLRFDRSQVDDRIRPDLFCHLTASPGDWPFARQSVVLRVWSEEISLSFREEWDSRRIFDQLTSRAPKRVMLRMHFDQADQGANEPRFHLQFGGRAQEEEEELSWHVPNIGEPRIPFPPLEIVLACELVVANFFPRFYETKKQEPQWRALVRRSLSVTKNYYGLCNASCTVRENGEPALLEKLWNS